MAQSQGLANAFRLRRTYNILEPAFGGLRDGVTSQVAAFQAAMTQLSSDGGGRLRLPTATYFFNITGDAATILIPSNVEIECEPGVIFKWGFWGSPLFAIVNKTNVRLKLNGAKFLWTGTFGTTVGSSDKFSYGRAISAYEWCSHIISVGSEFVEIEDARCAGDTTSNVQNNFVEFRGKSDGGLTEGNKVRRLYVDDVCQGLVWGEQKRFEIDGIDSDRYSNASDALYGPGHVLYVIAGSTASEAGKIRNITDRAGTALSAFGAGAHSVSLKLLKNSVVEGIYSRRAEGVLNFADLEDVDIDFRYHSAAVDDDTNSGIVFASEPTAANKLVKLKGMIIEDAQRNFALANFGGITAGSKNLYCEADLTVVRTGDGTESVSAVHWVGNFGNAKLTHLNKGSGAARLVVEARNTSEDNNFYVKSLGAVANPRVGTGGSGTSSRNTFWCSGDGSIYYDSNEFTPANGNTVVWESARQYVSRKTIGSTTDPTTTFQLPKAGAYLVHINLRSSDSNHARSGLYWVVFDNASVNDYTTTQLIGTQISKGGSAPTVLNLAVDNAGLCTLTSTAGSNTWVLDYGYRQITDQVA